MVLTNYEKCVLTELLSGVNADDLIQIAKTVSQKLIDINSTSRAVEVILLHSQTVESVLHRKKISKQLLFNYLHFKRIPVQPHLSKDEIILRLINYWKTDPNNVTEQSGIESQNAEQGNNLRGGDAYSSSWNPNLPSGSNSNTNHYSSPYEDPTRSATSSMLPQSSGAESQSASCASYPNSQHASIDNPYCTYESSSIVSQSQNLANPPSIAAGCDSESSQIDVVPNIDVNQLGLAFTKWFYDQLNGCNSSTEYFFDSSMFFSNATAEFRLVRRLREENDSGGQRQEQETDDSYSADSSEQIASTFARVQKAYNLYFHSNLNSVKSDRNSYGNVVLGVCGSLHTNSLVVGVYEQLFQLFNDPMAQARQNTNAAVWKIQKTMLNLKMSNDCRQLESGGEEVSSSLSIDCPNVLGIQQNEEASSYQMFESRTGQLQLGYDTER